FLFTSESVSEGHPDKVCDQVSDAIVDLYMAEPENNNRAAIECVATTDYLGIFGEARGPESVTHELIEKTAREVVKKIGYEQEGFNWKTMNVDVRVHKQSADIAVGVDEAGGKDEGAGDQGIMF